MIAAKNRVDAGIICEIEENKMDQGCADATLRPDVCAFTLSVISAPFDVIYGAVTSYSADYTSALFLC